ncbi:L-fucono-1,5-lactonase-like [Panulirus ornatus]|uniref:L-fucono-1,5-lactonase-like n=1 Tax=Panulirus ornatus TaxID=150431 RepID=UPI003A83C183
MSDWLDKVLDSHCHLWELERFRYPWPTPGMVIHRDHRVEDLWLAMSHTPVRDVVFVQCLNDSPEEAKWVMSLAREHPRIKGIVAGLDPSHSQFESRLEALQKEVPLLVGVRHILDLEPREKYLLEESLPAGLNALHKRNLTFDLLLRPPRVEDAAVLASRVPEAKMVVDHLAKPYIAAGKLDPWREHMAALARHPNVYCKLSGMVPEANLDSWKPEDFRPYVEHMLSVFGCDRLMFGSDWPVCRVAGEGTDYNEVFSTLRQLLQHLPDHQQEKIFCTNARTFYNIQ